MKDNLQVNISSLFLYDYCARICFNSEYPPFISHASTPPPPPPPPSLIPTKSSLSNGQEGGPRRRAFLKGVMRVLGDVGERVKVGLGRDPTL